MEIARGCVEMRGQYVGIAWGQLDPLCRDENRSKFCVGPSPFIPTLPTQYFAYKCVMQHVGWVHVGL